MIVTLEGEKYRVTIPTLKQMQFLHVRILNLPHGCYVQTTDKLGRQRIVLDTYGDIKPFEITEKKPDNLWLPMLIPLDQDNMPINMAYDNPDGTIVNYGSILLCDEPISVRRLEPLNVTSYFQSHYKKKLSVFDIRDNTAGKDFEVSWCWIHGCLICISPIVETTISVLERHDILPHG